MEVVLSGKPARAALTASYKTADTVSQLYVVSPTAMFLFKWPHDTEFTVRTNGQLLYVRK